MSEEIKKCPHCGCSLNKKRKKPRDIMGRLFLIIPVLAAIVMWGLMGEMAGLKSALFYLNLIALATILLTSLLAYREASQLGFGAQKNEIKPVVYFIGMVLLWPVVFPLYLFQRRKKGKKNRLVIAIITALIFSGSCLVIYRFLYISYGPYIAYPTDPAVLDSVDEWLSRQAIPLRAVEAGSGFDDLTPLKPLFKDVRIVALGEATHGTREFFQFKHRMLEFLVTQMGFTVFAIETSYPGCLPIDDYVMFGKGDPDKALAGQGFWTWNTEEVRDMIEWLRRHNSQIPEEKRVRFMGVDVANYSRAFSVIREFLSKTATDKLADAEAAMQPLWFQGQPITNETGMNFLRARKEAGPPLEGSVGWVLARTTQKMSSENFIVDLRAAPSQGPVAAWLATPHLMYGIGAIFSVVKPWYYQTPLVLGKTYDGLIFINRTTRARPAATPTDLSGIGKQDRND